MKQVDLGKVYDEFAQEFIQYMTLEGISRTDYTKAMHKVQDKYGLKQGHPQFLEWVFTCVGRSPVIIEDKEGDGAHDTDAN
jgi:hypothetical protein